MWCRSESVIRSVRRETKRPAESEWWQHGLLHGRRRTAAYSVQIIATAGQSLDVLLARAEMLIWPEPRCDYHETVVVYLVVGFT